AAIAAIDAVRGGRARLLMKGRIPTSDLVREILRRPGGLRTGRPVCQVVLMEIPRDGRRFLMAGTGILIRPNRATQAGVMEAAVDVSRALGADRPRVALMAATESENPAMEETLDAARLQRRNEAGEFPGCILQGPLSFDLAYAADAADKKRIR